MQTFMALNKLQQQQQQSSSSAPAATPPAAAEKSKDVVQIDGLPPNVRVVTASVGKKSKSKHVDFKSLFEDSVPKSAPCSSSGDSSFRIAQLDGYGSGSKGGGAAEESSSEEDSDVDDSSVVSGGGGENQGE